MCTIENCEKAVHSKGLCQNHYRQAQRAARGLRKPGPAPDPAKWRSRYNTENPGRSKQASAPKEKPELCVNGHAYSEGGYVNSRGSRVCRQCARMRTERYRDRVSPNRKRWEPIETRQAKRLAKIERKEYTDTHCIRGHEFTEKNTYHYPKYRQCKACIRLRALESSYSVTIEQVEAMTFSQGNKCAICKQEFTETPRVDHNHVTGSVRGLLCHHCNTGLGQFKDDVNNLENAITYLEKFTQTALTE